MVNNSLGRGQRVAILAGAIGMIAPTVYELKVAPDQYPDEAQAPEPPAAPPAQHQMTDADFNAIERAAAKRARRAAKRQRELSVSKPEEPGK